MEPRTIGLADRRRLGRMATGSRDRGSSETDRPRNTRELKGEGLFPRENMALTAPDTVAVTAFLAVSLSIYGRRMYLRLRYLFTAQRKEPRWDHLPTRLKNFVVYGIFQRKVAREWYAGVLHSFIFWAFVILGASVVEITAQAYAPGWRVPTPPIAGFLPTGPLYLAAEVNADLSANGVGEAPYPPP